MGSAQAAAWVVLELDLGHPGIFFDKTSRIPQIRRRGRDRCRRPKSHPDSQMETELGQVLVLVWEPVLALALAPALAPVLAAALAAALAQEVEMGLAAANSCPQRWMPTS